MCPSAVCAPAITPRWHYWEWSGLCWESITCHYTSVSQCPAITFQVALLGVEWVVLGIHHLPGGTTGSGVGCAGNPSHLITPVCPSVQPSPSRWHYWEWSGLCWESITSHYTSVSQCPAITLQVALLGVEWVVLGIHHMSLHQCVPVSSHHPPGGTTGSGVGCAGNPSHVITHETLGMGIFVYFSKIVVSDNISKKKLHKMWKRIRRLFLFVSFVFQKKTKKDKLIWMAISQEYVRLC